MRLTEITDDLTGAADSGSYFTARGRKVRICTNGRCGLEHEADEILTVNLSSRNTAQDKARQAPRRPSETARTGRLLYEEDWHRLPGQ